MWEFPRAQSWKNTSQFKKCARAGIVRLCCTQFPPHSYRKAQPGIRIIFWKMPLISAAVELNNYHAVSLILTDRHLKVYISTVVHWQRRQSTFLLGLADFRQVLVAVSLMKRNLIIYGFRHKDSKCRSNPVREKKVWIIHPHVYLIQFNAASQDSQEAPEVL